MKKILTIIFDGFGIREEENGNAIKRAEMKNFEDLWKNYPHSLLEASGKYVGLSDDQFGNSEVGHLTIGAGRLVKQNETIVTDFLKDGYLENENFNKMLLEKDKHFHIMGLASDGNVHANINHFLKLYNILVKNDIKNIHFHLITDGRDTNVHSSVKYISMIEDAINENNIGDITSICGRYYAMDRDDNLDRTKVYYDLLTKGIGIGALDPKKTIESFYEKGITDEFIKPIIVNINNKIKNGDNIIWMNYRADRAKQILNSFTENNVNGFDFSNCKMFSFLPVDENIKTISFDKHSDVDNSLGIYLSKLGLTQARVSESEKYPHVTYFFDGGYNGVIENCNKYEVSSPDVPTYDLKPEMSAVGVTKKVCQLMEEDYDFILVNFANPDMVGHTGNFEATVKACMTLDVCLGKLIESADDNFYKIILLSDHGNADTMIDEKGVICTTHTTTKVPFVIKDSQVDLKQEGDLTMVAPTILTYMDIALPKEMSNTDTLLK